MTRLFSCRHLPILLSCLLLATCSCAARTHLPTPPDPARVVADPDVKRLSAAETDFGFRLLHQLRLDQPSGNVFFSPFSISEALLLTMDGAGGQTQQDMAQTLGTGTLPQDRINAANSLLLPSLCDPDPNVQVSAANALWANRGVTFSPAFQASAYKFYNADATVLNFGTPAAAETINNWVSKNTQGKITKLVSLEDIAHAEVVLTNAVYFHGKWQSPFDKGETVEGPFTLPSGKTKTLPLMSQENPFAYLETPQFQAVSLPYGKGRMSLYVFLPKSGTADGFAQTLNSAALAKWSKAMRPAEMTLILPRFKADYTATLNKPLITLGMRSAFDPSADFGPMGLRGVNISAVIHKAVLDVDEEGTVAAAATGVEMTASARVPPPLTMRVDHPFVCVIRDNLTGTVLFEGLIRDPQ